MSLQGQLGIGDQIGDLNQIAEVPQALFIVPATTVGRNPQSPGRGEARAIIPEPSRQLRGAPVRAPGSGTPYPRVDSSTGPRANCKANSCWRRSDVSVNPL